MAAIRKRTKKAEPIAEVAPTTGVEEQTPVALPMRVAVSDLWELRLAQAEKKTAEAQAEAARMQRLYVLAKLDPKGLVLAVEKKLEDAKKSIEAAENRSLLAKKRMEYTLGRPMTGLAIDPDTGEVSAP